MTQNKQDGGSSPPPASKPSKVVAAKKVEGMKWAIVFDGPITRRDVSQLLRLLRVEFLRMKRRNRIEKRKSEKTKEISDGNERVGSDNRTDTGKLGDSDTGGKTVSAGAKPGADKDPQRSGHPSGDRSKASGKAGEGGNGREAGA